MCYCQQAELNFNLLKSTKIEPLEVLVVLCAVLPVGADSGYGAGPDIGGADDAFHAERD